MCAMSLGGRRPRARWVMGQWVRGDAWPAKTGMANNFGSVVGLIGVRVRVPMTEVPGVLAEVLRTVRVPVSVWSGHVSLNMAVSWSDVSVEG